MATADDQWQQLEPGLELGIFTVARSGGDGDSSLTILRISPQLWELAFSGISNTDETGGLTAREWANRYEYTAVINAGMFATDYTTHIGYLQFREHLNNSRVNNYRSIAAFDPRHPELAPFKLFDLDSPDVDIDTILLDYASAIQNLRLIKRPAENRWSQQEKRWSEAALGEDAEGHILFIFCRDAFTMHDFNEALIQLNIGIVTAQHLEGGLEAQLYINTKESANGYAEEYAKEYEIELSGSYDTAIMDNKSSNLRWPIPNVLGIRPRSLSTDVSK